MVPWYCSPDYASQAPELGELGHSIPLLLAPTCVGAIVLVRVRGGGVSRELGLGWNRLVFEGLTAKHQLAGGLHLVHPPDRCGVRSRLE